MTSTTTATIVSTDFELSLSVSDYNMGYEMAQVYRTSKASLVARASPHNKSFDIWNLDCEPDDHSYGNFDNHYYKDGIFRNFTLVRIEFGT